MEETKGQPGNSQSPPESRRALQLEKERPKKRIIVSKEYTHDLPLEKENDQ